MYYCSSLTILTLIVVILLSKDVFNQNLSYGGIKCVLKCSRMLLYHFILSKSLYKLTFTEGKTNRQVYMNNTYWAPAFALSETK